MRDGEKNVEPDAPAPAKAAGGGPEERPRSVTLAARGIRTSSEVAVFLSALTGDLMEEKVTTRIGSTAINAVGKLLKAAELTMRFGTSAVPNGDRDLVLFQESTKEDRMARLEREFHQLRSGAVA